MRVWWLLVCKYFYLECNVSALNGGFCDKIENILVLAVRACFNKQVTLYFLFNDINII